MLTVTFTIFSFGLYAVRKGKPRCFSHPFFCLIYLPDQRPMQRTLFRIPSCNSSFKQRTSCLAPIAALSHKIHTTWARQPLQLPATISTLMFYSQQLQHCLQTFYLFSPQLHIQMVDPIHQAGMPPISHRQRLPFQDSSHRHI